MQTTTYDAAGRRVAFRDRWRMSASASEETETQFVFDGDGRPVVERHGSRTINTPTPPPMVVATTGYQVWSSVLGTSLTSVNTSGEKVETKVFAGGTHIATQYEMNPATTSDDSLIFVTADPVTGSVARYSGSGASADIEESEPLGQMIETSDPGSGYPTSYEDVRGIARDPEWQCMLPKEFTGVFNEMPVHCKKEQLNGRDFNLPLALAESDPKRVVKPSPSLTDDRPPTLYFNGGGPSNLAFAAIPEVTAKKEDKKGTIVLPEENVEVEIPLIDVTDTGLVDASESETPFQMRLLDEFGNTLNDEWSLRSPDHRALSPKSELPVWCHPEVIQAMSETWNTVAVSQGIAPTEVGFTVEGPVGHRTINKASFTNQYKRLSITEVVQFSRTRNSGRICRSFGGRVAISRLSFEADARRMP